MNILLRTSLDSFKDQCLNHYDEKIIFLEHANPQKINKNEENLKKNHKNVTTS